MHLFFNLYIYYIFIHCLSETWFSTFGLKEKSYIFLYQFYEWLIFGQVSKFSILDCYFFFVCKNSSIKYRYQTISFTYHLCIINTFIFQKMNNFIVLTVCTVLSIYLIQPTLQAAHTHTKSVSIFYVLHIFKYVLLEEFMSKSRMQMGPKSYVFTTHKDWE